MTPINTISCLVSCSGKQSCCSSSLAYYAIYVNKAKLSFWRREKRLPFDEHGDLSGFSPFGKPSSNICLFPIANGILQLRLLQIRIVTGQVINRKLCTMP